MTLDRHRVLSANFVNAVEQADRERTASIRQLLFWIRRSLARMKPPARVESDRVTSLVSQRWCDSTERVVNDELTVRHHGFRR
jgi:hypothetical protein